MKPTQSFWKVVGLLAIFTLAPASIYLMYYRTGGPASQKELAVQKNLRFAFMGGEDAIDVAPLTTWPWVRMCAVTSGLTRDELTAVIGFEYKDYDQLHWLFRADTWTLLFIDSARHANWGEATPVTPVRVPRQATGDLALPEGIKGACVDRDHGRLFVTRRKDAPVGVSPVTVRVGRVTPAADIAPVPEAAP